MGGCPSSSKAKTAAFDPNASSEVETDRRASAAEVTRLAMRIQCNSKQIVVSAWGQCLELTGFLTSELVGQDISLLVPPNMRTSHRHILAHWFGMTQRFENLDFERPPRRMAIFCKNGQLRQVHICAKLSRCGSVASADVYVPAAPEPRTQEETNLTVRQTIHDLRTPLHSMTLVIDSLNHRCKELGDPETHNLLRQLQASTKHIAEILQRPTEDSAGAQQPVAIARAVCRLLGPSLQPGVELKLKSYLLRPEEMQAAVSRADLASVLRNLVDNAVKYTLDGYVTVSVFTDGEQLIFSVADTGIGVSPAQLEAYGIEVLPMARRRSRPASAVVEDETFSRGHRRQNSGVNSTGYGLRIVASLVQKHQLTMAFFSAPNGGTTVRLATLFTRNTSAKKKPWRLMLPRKLDPDATPPVSARSKTPLSGHVASSLLNRLTPLPPLPGYVSASVQPVTVLLVDDVSLCLMVTSNFILKNFPGVCVLTALNGEDALAGIRERGTWPDFLLTDMQMGEDNMTGVEFAQTVLQLVPQGHPLRRSIYLLSGAGPAGIDTPADLFAAVWEKPIDPAALRMLFQ